MGLNLQEEEKPSSLCCNKNSNC